MKGQWIGRTTGDQIGQIIINIDDRGTHYSGVAFTTPDDNKFPTSACSFNTADKCPNFNLTAFLMPIDPRNRPRISLGRYSASLPRHQSFKSCENFGAIQRKSSHFSLQNRFRDSYQKPNYSQTFFECFRRPRHTKILG
jgi:hypothetical protein